MNPVEQANLQTLNTLAIPGRARYLQRADTLETLERALLWARDRELPVLIWGEGSNLVLARDWPGLVLKPETRGFQVLREDADSVELYVAAGENWHVCVTRCVQAGWYGLENLALIPGTVGAAPVQNIGAYGCEIADCLMAVQAIDVHDGSHHRLQREDCAFTYRDSIFRGHLPNRWLITGIELRLSKQAQNRTDYPALAQALHQQGIHPQQATPEQIFQTVVAVRQSKLPDPARVPNAGSFFKNPVISEAHYQRLCQTEPGVVAYPAGAGQWKLAAGWLIDRAGLRGIEKDGVGTAASQALVLINPDRREANAVLSMAEHIRQIVQERFGVNLDIEPLVVNIPA